MSVEFFFVNSTTFGVSGVTITDLVGNVADVVLNDSPVVLHVDQAPP